LRISRARHRELRFARGAPLPMTHTSLGSPLSNSSESELPYLKRSAWIRVAVALIWVGAHLRRRAADCPVLAVGHENQERLLRRPPNQLVQDRLFTGTGRACGREKGWAWGVERYLPAFGFTGHRPPATLPSRSAIATSAFWSSPPWNFGFVFSPPPRQFLTYRFAIPELASIPNWLCWHGSIAGYTSG
jgi:hypothetical protein